MQANGSFDLSSFPGSRAAPSSTIASSSFLMPSVSGTNTTASSVVSAAAAVGDVANCKTLQQQVGAHAGSANGTNPSSPGTAAPAAAAGSPNLIIGPQKPSHRSTHNGVIQVLSVDDDPVNQLVASTSLKSNKWEVVKSMSGSEALNWLEKSDSMPDLVLLDVMMPSMSGFEVASRIREVYPSSLLPIIMVSYGARMSQQLRIVGPCVTAAYCSCQ